MIVDAQYDQHTCATCYYENKPICPMRKHYPGPCFAWCKDAREFRKREDACQSYDLVITGRKDAKRKDLR
jgi:N-acetyl-anhydromuramyl-L-alanine amidase AmpD